MTNIWNLALRRSFECAGRTVYVMLSALRTDTGEPQFEINWQPSRPERLSSEDMALFDRRRAQAVAELLGELEAL